MADADGPTRPREQPRRFVETELFVTLEEGEEPEQGEARSEEDIEAEGDDG